MECQEKLISGPLMGIQMAYGPLMGIKMAHGRVMEKRLAHGRVIKTTAPAPVRKAQRAA